MNKWFAGVTTIEELRRRYRELLKQFHPDNGGDEETKKASRTTRLTPTTKTPKIKRLKKY